VSSRRQVAEGHRLYFLSSQEIIRRSFPVLIFGARTHGPTHMPCWTPEPFVCRKRVQKGSASSVQWTQLLDLHPIDLGFLQKRTAQIPWSLSGAPVAKRGSHADGYRLIVSLITWRREPACDCATWQLVLWQRDREV